MVGGRDGGSWKFTVGLVGHPCWSRGAWQVHASKKESAEGGKLGSFAGIVYLEFKGWVLSAMMVIPVVGDVEASQEPLTNCKARPQLVRLPGGWASC